MPNIMIVDDQRSIANLWARGFKQVEFTVRVAYGGVEAIRDIQANGLPDLIILDQIMTYGGGVNVVQELEEIDPTRSTPIILVTAEPQVYHDELKERASAIIQKPILLRDLMAAVDKALSERGNAASIG